MPSAPETYAALVTAILAQLERGEMPWRRPWAFDRPGNLFTRRSYTGINVLALMLAAQERGYRSSLWTTATQAMERGGRVLAGELERPVHIAMMYMKSFTTTSGRGQRVVVRKLAGRSYPVYNLEQTRGLGRLVRPGRNLELWNLECDRIVRAWPGAPRLVPDPERAFYRPADDVVAIPDRDCFESDSRYYATLFHELIHATGHPTRLNRESFRSPAIDFGSEAYAFEELVAELGAAFLCSETGIGNATMQDNAAYIGGWLKVLRRDRKKLFLAAFLAERACDLVLGRVSGGKREVEAPDPGAQGAANMERAVAQPAMQAARQTNTVVSTLEIASPHDPT